MRENILSNVILLETNLSRGGKSEINLIKHIQDKWCLPWRHFYHHKQIHHSYFWGNILKLNLVSGKKVLDTG